MLGRFSVAVSVALIAAGCADGAAQRAPHAVPRSPAWERATAQQEGIDVQALDRADLKGITSLLIARHGRLVVERDYGGMQAADRVPVFSITKTAVSSPTGISISEGGRPWA